MVLNGVKLADFEGVFNIRIMDGLIVSVNKEAISRKADAQQLTLTNNLAFPGLINSHDHLEFNLFPQLGNKTYANYVEWGEYIHQHYKNEIGDILKIPIKLRAKWGIYKNLLCGITTVVNHGPDFKLSDAPITVIDQNQTLHSVKLEKNWRSRLNNLLKVGVPAVIHVGEGTDEESEEEINELIRWNIFTRDMIGVHGVAMNAKQAACFKALVWCPETNYFLLGKTAEIDKIKSKTTVLFGSDSTLTGNWDIWKHIRLAQKTGLLTKNELIRSLTSAAAKIWKLNTGLIEPGRGADVIVVKEKANDIPSFFNTRPEDILLVVHKGSIRLFDGELLPQLTNTDIINFSKVYINGACKYVQGNLPALMKEIRQYHPYANFPVQVNHHQTA